MGAPASIRVFDSLAQLQAAAAESIVAAAHDALGRRGVFHLVLAGGNTPRGLYELLASPAWRGRIDWHNVHIWFGDERCVPPDHPDSNFHMARQALLAHVPLRARRIHRMRGEAPPQAAARAYTKQLRRAGLGFDLVLLGMGADGHTASLFPGSPQLREQRRLVVPAVGSFEPRQRLSLTLVAFRAARQIAFLVAGPDKASAVARVLEPSRGRTGDAASAAERSLDEQPLPASLVRAEGGQLPVWWLDAEAARELSRPS